MNYNFYLLILLLNISFKIIKEESFKYLFCAEKKFEN